MDNCISQNIKERVRSKALELGFEACGFAIPERLAEEEPRLKEWLDNGHHAGMGYMTNHFNKRLDPTLLVEGAKTVITLLFSYNFGASQKAEAPRVARYAWFRDYHKELKQRLKVLMAFLTDETGITVNGRYFTDSAPILERAWASRSGLGWIGKNSLLIHPKLGSYTLLAELIVDLEIEPDQPFGNSLCGACTRCIDSCPTGAIIAPAVVDANRCISYHTIEHKGPFSAEQEQLVNGHAFGCDICQEVCPWNKKPIMALQGKVAINDQLLELSAADWRSLNEDRVEEIFKGSAVKRAGFSGIMRNLRQQNQ
ncbi:MAG TPA: tRNA epoxyqueuosine(34) reductase QueG [Williamwhitmania sp.]|nr:tRNA epoxyqueuosine(34) reductase QueG [Williamwhitmania sp.]